MKILKKLSKEWCEWADCGDYNTFRLMSLVLKLTPVIKEIVNQLTEINSRLKKLEETKMDARFN